MARKDEHTLAKELTAAMVAPVAVEIDINDMPLLTLGDHVRYNAKARELNKKLRLCRYPIKPCPEELHPVERIVLSRNDKNTSNVKVFVSNDMIHFDKLLTPGTPYDLPRCIVKHLANRGIPVWKWFNMGDGAKETRVSHKEPRFSIQTIYKD